MSLINMLVNANYKGTGKEWLFLEHSKHCSDPTCYNGLCARARETWSHWQECQGRSGCPRCSDGVIASMTHAGAIHRTDIEGLTSAKEAEKFAKSNCEAAKTDFEAKSRNPAVPPAALEEAKRLIHYWETQKQTAMTQIQTLRVKLSRAFAEHKKTMTLGPSLATVQQTHHQQTSAPAGAAPAHRPAARPAPAPAPPQASPPPPSRAHVLVPDDPDVRKDRLASLPPLRDTSLNLLASADDVVDPDVEADEVRKWFAGDALRGKPSAEPSWKVANLLSESKTREAWSGALLPPRSERSLEYVSKSVELAAAQALDAALLLAERRAADGGGAKRAKITVTEEDIRAFLGRGEGLGSAVWGL